MVSDSGSTPAGTGGGWVRRCDRVISGRLLFKGSQILATVVAVSILLLMVITFIGVIGRHSPWAGAWLTGGNEISGLLMGEVAVFAAAYCWYIGGHLRIGLLRDRCSPRIKAGLDAVCSFIFLAWTAAIVWGMVGMSMTNVTEGVGTVLVGIPIGPFQIVFLLVMAHFALVLLRSFLGLSSKASGHRVEHDGLY